MSPVIICVISVQDPATQNSGIDGKVAIIDLSIMEDSMTIYRYWERGETFFFMGVATDQFHRLHRMTNINAYIYSIYLVDYNICTN